MMSVGMILPLQRLLALLAITASRFHGLEVDFTPGGILAFHGDEFCHPHEMLSEKYILHI